MVSRGGIILFFGLAAAALGAQDWVEQAKARKAKIAELRKQVEGDDEGAKLGAISELGGIRDDDARSILARKLTTDSDSVRQAAAKAIAGQKDSATAQSLGRAIQANAANPVLVKAFIDALGELDMCAGIQPLILALEIAPAQGADALAALEKIGCPDAVPPLLRFLQKAEIEEKKPDFFEEANMGGGGGLPGTGGGGVGRAENRNKDKTLAALAPKVRSTLSRLTGASHSSFQEWAAAIRSGQVSVKKASIYLCEKSGQNYEVPSGGSNKCPNADGKTYHSDIFLKHRRE